MKTFTPFFDRVFQVGRAERGVGGQHGDIARLQAIDRLL